MDEQISRAHSVELAVELIHSTGEAAVVGGAGADAAVVVADALAAEGEGSATLAVGQDGGTKRGGSGGCHGLAARAEASGGRSR